MRILFLTQWFQPESFFKGLPFASALAARGHAVEVLTGFPNYPGGQLYPGYRIRFYQRQMMDGIPVHRVPLYPSHDRSPLRRILNYTSFALSSLLLGPWIVKKPDVIYVYNLVTLGPAAFLLRLLYGAKVIFDVQDLWPESVANSKMLRNSILLRMLCGICNWVYRRADHLTVLSPGFRKELIDRGVKPEKVEVVYNWCDEDSVGTETHLSDDLRFEDRFVVLFAGAMGFAQGLDTVLDCAGLCEQSLPDVHFVLIGGGVDRARLEKRAEEMQLKNMTFLPARPITAMGEVYARADALLVHLKDDPLYRITIPSKTQAYLFMGKPIIMAMHGNAAALVQTAGAGIVCDPDDPKGMMNAIRVLHEMPSIERQIKGKSGRDFYLAHLSFGKGLKKFEKIFNEARNL